MAFGSFQKHPGQPEQWISNMPLLDLLYDLGESALFREKVDLDWCWLDLGTWCLFFPPLKARPIGPWRLRTAAFGGALDGSARDGSIGGGGPPIRLFLAIAIARRGWAPGA